jgi:hypothetical protein
MIFISFENVKDIVLLLLARRDHISTMSETAAENLVYFLHVFPSKRSMRPFYNCS